MTQIEGAPTGAVAVRAAVRDVTAQLAPDELPLLEGLRALDDGEVARRFARGEKREALAFGFGELAEMTSPVVWIALDEAARRFGEKSADGVTRGARAALRRVLRRRPQPVLVPPLSRAQLGQVREMVLRLSKERGVDGKRAEAIADAVTARLALAPQQPDPAAPGSGTDGGAPR